MAGGCPGVDAADPHDSLGDETVRERAGRAPVRRAARRIPYHIAAHPDARRLVVLVVDAAVADVRRRLHHDLTVVGRVGQRLLVAGHRGGEHCLAERLADRAVSVAVERPPVLQDEDRGGAGRHATTRAGSVTVPFRTVGTPRRNVATTRSGSFIPAYGVLRLLLASAPGSTTHDAAGSTSVNVAGAPGAGSWPWSVSPAMRAGARDMRSAMPSQSSPPAGPSLPARHVIATIDSAVSRPSMPGRAYSHSHSLSSVACGAWSVATTSITPSTSAARSASTSALVRNGGFTFNTGSYAFVAPSPATSSSVSSR